MMLLLVIAGSGAWCAHQHWMRLDKKDSFWRRGFWPWAIRGFALPALVWALANFGFGDRFPPLVPELADAQAARQPWVRAWLNVSMGGGVVILSFWAAVSYLWIVSTMLRLAVNRAELVFNLAVFGVLAALCGAAVFYAGGWIYAGAAVVVTFLPGVYLTLDLAEQPPQQPVYDRAVGQMKFGKYEAAEWELISQLEKREDDFQGWMMLAELYARQHRNIEDAARVILDICQNPSTQPAEISLACHTLADWQLEIAENPEGARAALNLLCRKLPGTHFARMAEQRLKQLPRDAAEFEEHKKPKRIQMPALSENQNDHIAPRMTRSEAARCANQLSARLTDDPNDIGSREQLAAVLAADLGKTELGIEQLRLLLDLPDAPEVKKAKWLAQIAAWEWKSRGNQARYAALLRELIEKYPHTPQAFAAQRQLFLLGQAECVPRDEASVPALQGG